MLASSSQEAVTELQLEHVQSNRLEVRVPSGCILSCIFLKFCSTIVGGGNAWS